MGSFTSRCVLEKTHQQETRPDSLLISNSRWRDLLRQQNSPFELTENSSESNSFCLWWLKTYQLSNNHHWFVLSWHVLQRSENQMDVFIRDTSSVLTGGHIDGYYGLVFTQHHYYGMSGSLRTPVVCWTIGENLYNESWLMYATVVTPKSPSNIRKIPMMHCNTWSVKTVNWWKTSPLQPIVGKLKPKYHEFEWCYHWGRGLTPSQAVMMTHPLL